MNCLSRNDYLTFHGKEPMEVDNLLSELPSVKLLPHLLCAGFPFSLVENSGLRKLGFCGENNRG